MGVLLCNNNIHLLNIKYINIRQYMPIFQNCLRNQNQPINIIFNPHKSILVIWLKCELSLQYYLWRWLQRNISDIQINQFSNGYKNPSFGSFVQLCTIDWLIDLLIVGVIWYIGFLINLLYDWSTVLDWFYDELIDWLHPPYTWRWCSGPWPCRTAPGPPRRWSTLSPTPGRKRLKLKEEKWLINEKEEGEIFRRRKGGLGWKGGW